MNIEELDIVKLKDGRVGTVMTVYSGGRALEVEFDWSENSDVQTVEISEVESITKTHRSRS